MLVVEVIVAGLVLFAIAVVAAGRGGSISEASPDGPDVGLPEGRLLGSEDVPRLRFRLAVRGYRMADVDQAMDRLRDSLVALEARPETRLAERPFEPPSPPTPVEPPRPPDPPRPEEPMRPEEPQRPQEPVVPPPHEH